MKALVIVASGLHLGYIGCYGNEWVETPALDRLAANGVVFDQHYADQPDAVGAQRAWQTGSYKFPSLKAEAELPSREAANLLLVLAGQGVTTHLISDDRNRPPPSPPAGWQHLHLLQSAAEQTGLPEQMREALAEALIGLTPCKQWLLRFDLGVLVPPWDSPEDLRNRYRTPRDNDEEDESLGLSADAASWDPEETEDLAYSDLQDHYAAAVTYVDAGIGQVLQELEQRSLLEEMLVLVTSDGGQKLGEEALWPGTRLSLHEELLHVPLILRLPGKGEAGRRVSAFTQPVDLLPTLFEAFGVPLPLVHGQSFLPLARGESHAIREYACAGFRTGDAIEWALRSPDWYYVWPVSSSPGDLPRESELYVKPDDRWEVNNVRQHQLELCERLEHTLRGFVEATRGSGPLRPPELPHPELEAARKEPDPTCDLPERSITP